MTQLIFQVNSVDSIKKNSKFPLISHHNKNQNFQRNQRFLCKRKYLWICDSRTSLKKTNLWKFETNSWPFQKPLKREKSTNDETQLKNHLLTLNPPLLECRFFIFGALPVPQRWLDTSKATLIPPIVTFLPPIVVVW